MYKMLCDEPRSLDELIEGNKNKIEMKLSSLKEEVNKKGNQINAKNIKVFENIKSAATEHSKKVNKVSRIKECVDIYKDWLKKPEGPGRAMKFIQMPAKITLIIREMIKTLNFSDFDKKELDGLHKKSIDITGSIQGDTKITNIVEYVINTNKLNTNNLIKLKIEVIKMCKIAKGCQ